MFWNKFVARFSDKEPSVFKGTLFGGLFIGAPPELRKIHGFRCPHLGLLKVKARNEHARNPLC